MQNSSPSPSPQGEGEAPGADGVDWAEVRKAYEFSEETVPYIRKRFGLTIHGLRSRRIAEGWTARPLVAVPLRLPKRGMSVDEAIELKLNRMLAVASAMLEKRLADEGATEVNARTLVELCRAEELRMRSTKHRTAKTRETKNADAGSDFRDDPAWLRAELERRLAHLREEEGDRGAAQIGEHDGAAGLSGGLGE